MLIAYVDFSLVLNLTCLLLEKSVVLVLVFFSFSTSLAKIHDLYQVLSLLYPSIHSAIRFDWNVDLFSFFSYISFLFFFPFLFSLSQV